MIAARRTANAYLAGVCLGLLLLLSLGMTGRGLGASGAFASAAAGLVASASPPLAESNAYLQGYLADGGFRSDWLVFEVAGVFLGAALSALLSGRWRACIERGPQISSAARLCSATVGGVAMGVGAVFARGCTSGQALSGGALLSVGSWVFMLAVFASAYLVAPLARGLWR